MKNYKGDYTVNGWNVDKITLISDGKIQVKNRESSYMTKYLKHLYDNQIDCHVVFISCNEGVLHEAECVCTDFMFLEEQGMAILHLTPKPRRDKGNNIIGVEYCIRYCKER